MLRSVPLVDDPLFDEHRPKGYHPERPERLLAARAAVASCELGGTRFVHQPPRDASVDELARVHDGAYLEALAARRGVSGALDDDTYVGPHSVAAAERAAGGAIGLVETLWKAGDPTVGLALLRPPGHHARPSGGMGFCLLNNIALGAAHARTLGAGRVAIVDWDVHHGNGTQDAFYDDPNVLFISLHQAPFYPRTGRTDEMGGGAGQGFNVNIPLAAGAGDSVYRAAFERIVSPILELYAPDLILVSAGFDGHARDPLAGMSLSDAGFAQMARAVAQAAARSSKGKLGLLLEGGYDLEGLETSLAASLNGATATSVSSAGAPSPAQVPSPALAPRHEGDLQRALSAARAHWKI